MALRLKWDDYAGRSWKLPTQELIPSNQGQYIFLALYSPRNVIYKIYNRNTNDIVPIVF
jgi:hypothetical protein